LKVADYPGVVEAASAYLAGQGSAVSHAVFAMAGPVTGKDRFEMTNFDWAFSIEKTRKSMGLDKLTLINDFHAMALGVMAVESKHLHRIGGGIAKPDGNIGVLGPGTGLGVASLIFDHSSKRYVIASGEGGHVTMPMLSQREFDLKEWLLEHKYTHISAERVCSGKGLVNIYDAIRGVDKRDLPDLSPEDITARAKTDECPACKEALTLMLGFLGRVAGNLALTNMTTGGVYLVGGILPRIGMPHLMESRLRGEFTTKGRHTALVDEIPIFVVDDTFVALKGLRAVALQA